MRETAIESVVEVHRKADRMTPRESGYLRSHLEITHGAQPQAPRTAKRPTEARRRAIAGKGPPDIRAALADFKLGEKIRISWLAWYGVFVEYGTSKNAPVGFVRRAAGSWDAIVRRNVAKTAARMRGKPLQ